MQLFGEVWNLAPRRAKVFFELRDAYGAMPCSMWREDLERLGLDAATLRDGAQVVVAGGCDFYPGSRAASPSFTFLVRRLRVAGAGDLLAQVDRLRKLLDGEGLCDLQARLARPSLPRTIGVVTGEHGKARDDVLAGLHRRGWAGRLIWAFAPVQDRHAAGRITQAIRDLAAVEAVDVVIVTRGGGSLADLFAFCDETLCRTVALLRVPVVASVGHHTDRTLIDDVAAVSCSTPTHAAEAAVPLHCIDARVGLARDAERLSRHGRAAVAGRARTLVALARAPAQHIARHRGRLHQQVRELRASTRRRLEDEHGDVGRALLVLGRKATSTGIERDRAGARLARAAASLERSAHAAEPRRARDLERLAMAIAAHEPQRTLERGYALVESPGGAPLASADAARAAGDVAIRFADGTARATVSDAPSPEEDAP